MRDLENDARLILAPAKGNIHSDPRGGKPGLAFLSEPVFVVAAHRHWQSDLQETRLHVRQPTAGSSGKTRAGISEKRIWA